MLVRQFARGSAGLVALLLILLWILTRDPRLLIGTLVGSGWMVANCTALAWISARALRPGQPHGRVLIALLTIVSISLALMAWAVTAWQPSLFGVGLGVLLPLAFFLVQLRRLNLAVQSHAR